MDIKNEVTCLPDKHEWRVICPLADYYALLCGCVYCHSLGIVGSRAIHSLEQLTEASQAASLSYCWRDNSQVVRLRPDEGGAVSRPVTVGIDAIMNDIQVRRLIFNALRREHLEEHADLLDLQEQPGACDTCSERRWVVGRLVSIEEELVRLGDREAMERAAKRIEEAQQESPGDFLEDLRKSFHELAGN